VTPQLAGSLRPGSAVRDTRAPLSFGRVHVQRPKPLEISLQNPTLVDALWAVTSGDHKPTFCEPGRESAAAAAYSQVQIGPFIISPARGVLPGRGIKLPRTQRVTVTFAPPDNGSYQQQLTFVVSRGRPVHLMVTGQGSFDETEEFQDRLFQI
jgi:hypothetical protein